jgi:hypothetical protein
LIFIIFISVVVDSSADAILPAGAALVFVIVFERNNTNKHAQANKLDKTE